MPNSAFSELEFFLLIATSLFIPIGIYIFLLLTKFVSRTSILALAIVLIVLSGIDLVLLRHLAHVSKLTPSTMDDALFVSGISFALYLLPVTFTGLGVNLLSHLLIDHLCSLENKHKQSPAKIKRYRRH